MSENTSNTTTVKPHFKLWAKKVEANEVTPQHPHKPFPGWVYGVLFVIFDIIVVTALEVGVSSSSTRVQLSSPTVGFGFVSKMWTDGNFVFVLNVTICSYHGYAGRIQACCLYREDAFRDAHYNRTD